VCVFCLIVNSSPFGVLGRKFGEKNVLKCGEVERRTDLFLVFLHAGLELMLVAIVALL